MNHLVAIGFGYSARRLAGLLAPAGWQVTGTSRSAAGVSEITAAGFRGALFAGDGSGGGNEGVPSALAAALEGATHVLVSAPPTAAGDPVLACLGDHLAGLSTLGWVGYFSTVGVYGDRDGGWVDETTPAAPTGERGRRRLAGETAWRAWGKRSGKTVLSLRLPGIYGPGRSPLERVRAGTAQRIIKPGQVFNRIHVDDIAGAVRHIMTLGDAALGEAARIGVINITDDLPAPPQDVIAHAAALLGVAPPPEVAFEEADLSEMARSFYAENKRVSNRLLREGLGYDLVYPTYREGLAALLDGQG